MSEFKFGVDGLDSLYPGVLRRGSLVVVYGKPGSGKTVLSMTICYKNSLNGYRSYYITLYENKESLYMFARSFNMDFSELEGKGLFKYVKLPLATGSIIKELIENLMNDIMNFKPDIVVVDSITPLINAIGDNRELRALLHNFLYELPRLINGVVILVAEVGDRLRTLIDLGYVADVVLGLNVRYVDGLIIREFKFDKIRGSPNVLARIPFSIVEKSGIMSWIPPKLDEIPPPNFNKVFKLPCPLLNELIGDYLYGGWNVFITYDADVRSYDAITAVLAAALFNKSKTLIITYKFAPEDLLVITEKYIKSTYGVEVDLRKAFQGNLIMRGLNPGTYSIEELYSMELDYISKVKPDIVLFMGIDIPRFYYGNNLFKYLHNELLYLKKLGVLSFRLGSYVDDHFYKVNAVLSDVIIRILYDKRDLSKSEVHAWARGKAPSVITFSELSKCLNDVADVFRSAKMTC